MIKCQQPQAQPARCGCEQETSAGRNVHASESGLPYAVRAASSASHHVSPAIIASDPRLMKAESSAERTLRNLGYTDNGGELWKPPIGEKPNFSLIDALRQQLADVSNERDGLRAERDQLKARCDGFERLLARIMGKREVCLSSYWFEEIESALSKPATPVTTQDQVALPERKHHKSHGLTALDSECEGWNACLDEVAKLNSDQS
ncbi:hypothetical protein KTT58_17155 [Pseudomonas viridiflava]|uniref:hypothetical protein n=1 Tax=Pseudomonas viridiflava TaxID=33069 RepID=UPI001C2D4583|nr:hypothetical protein [Pseudomonas viridiflava]MBV1814475.1 hypothetical protein [Pseudomonas viridiflava]